MRALADRSVEGAIGRGTLARIRERGDFLALAEDVGKRRRVLGLDRDDDKSEHEKVVDDRARKGNPLVLEVAREDGLELDIFTVAPHHDAAAQQLAEEDLARGLDARRRVVEVLQRDHRVDGDFHLAGRAGLDGIERRRRLAALVARGISAGNALAEVHFRTRVRHYSLHTHYG